MIQIELISNFAMYYYQHVCRQIAHIREPMNPFCNEAVYLLLMNFLGLHLQGRGLSRRDDTKWGCATQTPSRNQHGPAVQARGVTEWWYQGCNVTRNSIINWSYLVGATLEHSARQTDLLECKDVQLGYISINQTKVTDIFCKQLIFSYEKTSQKNHKFEF